MVCITKLKSRGDSLSPYLMPLFKVMPSNKSFPYIIRNFIPLYNYSSIFIIEKENSIVYKHF